MMRIVSLMKQHSNDCQVTEPGNTGVTTPVSISTLKGRDPETSGATSGAKAMSRQVRAAAGKFSPSGVRRHAAKAVVMLGALALIVAMAVPSSAQAATNEASLEAVFGTAVEVLLPGVIVVATDSGVVRLIMVEDSLFTGDITALEDVSEGDRIIATIRPTVNGARPVDRILILPDLTQTVTRHILGVIIDVDDGTVTMQDRDSNTVVIHTQEGGDIPDAGTAVTVVAQLDRATGRLQAQAFESVADKVARLQEARDSVDISANGIDPEYIEDLDERLTRARDQHLSTLDRAREALERAEDAVDAAVSEREEAQRRLAEVRATFDALRQRYTQEANDRDQRSPQLLVTGTLRYSEDNWHEDVGSFSLSPRINGVNDSKFRSFAWNEETLAILPVEVQKTDSTSPAITAKSAQSIALPLNDVKGLISSGSQVTVQYDPDAEPPLATLVTVLPPELSNAVKNALDRERLLSVSGSITFLEETPDLATTTAVIVVANRSHDVKVVAKITADTTIEIDNEPAQFGQLAAGMAVEVDFDAAYLSIEGEEEEVIASPSLLDSGRLNALRIRARSVVDESEAHVAGVIAGLDPETRAVAILPGTGEVVRATVVDEAVIIKDGEQGRFDSLAAGDLVLDATRYNRDTLVLNRLVVQSPRMLTLTGAISGVDRNPNRLTVTASDGTSMVIFVGDETKISSGDGAPIDFSDLSMGNRIVKASVELVRRDARTILVAQELVVGEPAISTARGVVTTVDSDSGEIGITTSANSAISDPVELVLTLDGNNRSIMTKNDVRVRSLETVEIGDIVEVASYATATGMIVKMSVVSPDLHRVRGIISVVMESGVTLIETNNGRTIELSVSENTLVTLNGRRVESASDLSAGQVVSEAIYIADGDDVTQGSALRLTVVSRQTTPGFSISPVSPPTNPLVETSVSGVIRTISILTREDDEWVIGARKFLVTSETILLGETPEEGLVAKATLRIRADGVFVAVAVSVAGRPGTKPSAGPVNLTPVSPEDNPNVGDTTGLVRISGKVQDLGRAENGHAVVALEGVKITINGETIIAGDAVVNANARAVVRRDPDGDIVALTITFTAPSADNGSGPGDGDSTEEDPSDTGVTSPDSDESGYETHTVVVEKASGRMILANGQLYFLRAEAASGRNKGDTITVRVRKVSRGNIIQELTFFDRVLVSSNPLYQETSSIADSALYVSE